MYCPKCGEPIEDGSDFCSYCGESITRKAGKATIKCARCGGTGKIMGELGFMVHCPACKGTGGTEEV